MTDKTQELLPVTQVDREAAAPFATGFGYLNGYSFSDSHLIREGRKDDHALVQAFVRHRLSHSLPGDVGCCDCSIREALVGMVENFAPPITDHNPALLAKIEAHETALRALAALTTTTGQSTTPLLEEEV